MAVATIASQQAITASPVAAATAAKISAYLFLNGVGLVVLFGFFRSRRTLPGAKSALQMPVVIEIVMLSVAAIMLLATKIHVDVVPTTSTLRAPVDVRVRALLRLGDALQPGGDDARADATGHRAGHPTPVPDCDVPVGQWLFLHPDLRLADRGDQLRPLRHDEDRQVRAQPLVRDSGCGGHGRGSHHRAFPRTDHVPIDRGAPRGASLTGRPASH